MQIVNHKTNLSQTSEGHMLSGMSSTKLRHIIFLQLFALLISTAVSCNSKSHDDENEIVVTPAIVAVKEFRLTRNDSVIANLDSVFFSIDLNTGVIFNADSLPKGTRIDKLIPKITFANSMTKADLTFKMENGSDTTVNYLTNPTDTIDFSSPVALEVTAQDGVNTFTYQIKVNVHKQNPDTIVWVNLDSYTLPYRVDNGKPVAQHTIRHDNVTYCLVEENNGEFTLSSSDDLNKNEWKIESFSPGFIPCIESFTATPDSFYLLSDTGELFESSDLATWVSTGQRWINILGAYSKSILGIRESASDFLHTCYPQPEGFKETPVEKGFPINSSSTLGLIETEWADNPMAILACGIIEEGVPSSNVWAYDGTTWAIINQGVLPALVKPMLTRYVVYRDTPYIFTKREFEVWLLLGGYAADNEMNRKIYLSYDNGVHWSEAPESMQLTQNIPALGDADVIVAGYALSADLSEAWTPTVAADTRTSYTIDGFDITWVCPYMYIFGGYLSYPYDSLNTNIYRGVLERLKFVPSI